MCKIPFAQGLKIWLQTSNNVFISLEQIFFSFRVRDLFTVSRDMIVVIKVAA